MGMVRFLYSLVSAVSAAPVLTFTSSIRFMAFSKTHCAVVANDPTAFQK